MSLYIVFFGDGSQLRVRAMSPKQAWESAQELGKEVVNIRWVR